MLSNSNPAGLNQGLSQHPLPEAGGIHTLGVTGTTLPFVPIGSDGGPGVGNGIDTLLVAAPAAGSGVVRRIHGDEAGGPFGFLRNLSGVDATVGKIIYKDGKGNEAILNDFGGIGNGQTAGMGIDNDFFLTEDDAGGGIYARVGAMAAVPAAPAFEGYAASEDVRGIERYVVPLTPAKVGLLPVIPYGEALRVFKAAGGEEVVGSIWLLNYDDVNHGDEITISLSDAEGEVTLLTPGNVQVVQAGEGRPFLDGQNSTGSQGRGENINVVDTVGVSDKTPVLMTAVVRTNQGPVSPDKGGAY